MAKFATNASDAIWWLILQLSVRKLFQVRDAIPWVRCASGNVFSSVLTIAFKYSVVLKSCSVYHRLTDPTCPKLSKLHTVLNQPKSGMMG